MSDNQKVVIGAVVVGVLLLLWFLSIAARAVRNRRPHGKSVTAAVQKAIDLESGDRPGRMELTEHVSWFDKSEPRDDGWQAAVGKRGYLALNKRQLIFVPYHRADPVVFERDRLSAPGSKHKKVWKKARGSFWLEYRTEGGAAPTRVSFKVRAPYTWMYHFGFRSGLADDPFS